MSWPIKWLRDTATNLASYTGPLGSFVVDTTNWILRVQDGSTAGGWSTSLSSRTPIADAAYQALATDRIIAYTSITTTRKVTLPAASAFPTGALLWIVDESGSVTQTINITVGPAGADNVNGVTTLSTIVTPYGFIYLESDGVSEWTIIKRSQNIQLFAGSGTYTPQPGMKLCDVYLLGGGGGGGSGEIGRAHV